MPIYEYIAEAPGCEHCEQPFEVMQKIADAELTQCPQCGAAVHRMISAPSLAIGGSHLTKESHAEKRGFTQYRKVGGGVYEKAFGKGPRYISDK
jgi:putative FmdB family regulatory protein